MTSTAADGSTVAAGWANAMLSGVIAGASVQDYLSTLGVDSKLSSGHSLGTLSNIYLGSNGLAGKVYLYSVPFGAVAPPNAEIMLGTWDLVNGGWTGKLFNWDAKMIPLAPWEHSFENYKKHIAK